jgi:hypothetical protein
MSEWAWYFEATEVVSDLTLAGRWLADQQDAGGGKLLQEWLIIPWPLNNDVPAMLRGVADEWEAENEREAGL